MKDLIVNFDKKNWHAHYYSDGIATSDEYDVEELGGSSARKSAEDEVL